MKASKLTTPLAFETRWVAIPLKDQPNRILELMAKYGLMLASERDSHRFEFNPVIGGDSEPLCLKQFLPNTASPSISKEFGWELRPIDELPSSEKLASQEYLDSRLFRPNVFHKLSDKMRYAHVAVVYPFRSPSVLVDALRYSNCFPYAVEDGVKIQDFLRTNPLGNRNWPEVLRFTIKKFWYDTKIHWWDEFWHASGWRLEPIPYSEAMLGV